MNYFTTFQSSWCAKFSYFFLFLLFCALSTIISYPHKVRVMLRWFDAGKKLYLHWHAFPLRWLFNCKYFSKSFATVFYCVYSIVSSERWLNYRPWWSIQVLAGPQTSSLGDGLLEILQVRHLAQNISKYGKIPKICIIPGQCSCRLYLEGSYRYKLVPLTLYIYMSP